RLSWVRHPIPLFVAPDLPLRPRASPGRRRAARTALAGLRAGDAAPALRRRLRPGTRCALPRLSAPAPGQIARVPLARVDLRLRSCDQLLFISAQTETRFTPGFFGNFARRVKNGLARTPGQTCGRLSRSISSPSQLRA